MNIFKHDAIGCSFEDFIKQAIDQTSLRRSFIRMLVADQVTDQSVDFCAGPKDNIKIALLFIVLANFFQHFYSNRNIRKWISDFMRKRSSKWRKCCFCQSKHGGSNPV